MGTYRVICHFQNVLTWGFKFLELLLIIRHIMLSSYLLRGKAARTLFVFLQLLLQLATGFKSVLSQGWGETGHPSSLEEPIRVPLLRQESGKGYILYHGSQIFVSPTHNPDLKISPGEQKL